jgi:predicted TIM-barrel fold metal-dependent hydrolase
VPETEAAKIRAKLGHPIVDCDGHWQEPIPVFLDYLRDVAGPDLMQKFIGLQGGDRRWYQSTAAERMDKRLRRTSWWNEPSGTLDFATARFPRLLHDRLGELGVDFAIMYPTRGMMFEGISDEALRKAVVRAFNTMTADLFRPYRDRFAPVAIVHRWTAQEAIEETRHAVQELGFKAILLNGAGMRTVSSTKSRYVDTLGLDNTEDYDALFRECMNLGVAITTHGGSLSWPDHASVTNHVFNHVGHFAQANHATAKALFLGGVVSRFPALNFALLEGGVGWASNLLCDLLGHWEKRRFEFMDKHLRPDRVDIQEFARLFDAYASDAMNPHRKELVDELPLRLQELSEQEKDNVDDFAAVPAKSKRDLAELFTRSFYFGCEADDPATMWAFDKRMPVRLKPLLSSDFSHWDVPDMLEVVPEAYEMVEKGWLSEDDFREFSFTNAVHLHGGMNPDFFKGTAIEKEAEQALAQPQLATVRNG